MKKLSFLIPAHNEEKIIFQALNNLSTLHYQHYEVLVGLDGCTDRTPTIVGEFVSKNPKIFKSYVINTRQGKPAVIDALMTYVTGDIIIIHDADWIFKVNDHSLFLEMISWFDDLSLGGVAESFPIEFDEHLKKRSLVFNSVAWSHYFWFEYQKKKFTKRKDERLYIDKEKMSFPFLTNIYRRSLYKKNTTLADDFERTLDILQRGYDIIVLSNAYYPRMVTSYHAITLHDVYKQKKRTAIARKQLFSKYHLKTNFLAYYFGLFVFMLRNIGKTRSLKGFFGVVLWFVIMGFSIIKPKKNTRTKEGWLLRVAR